MHNSCCNRFRAVSDHSYTSSSQMYVKGNVREEIQGDTTHGPLLKFMVFSSLTYMRTSAEDNKSTPLSAFGVVWMQFRN